MRYFMKGDLALKKLISLIIVLAIIFSLVLISLIKTPPMIHTNKFIIGEIHSTNSLVTDTIHSLGIPLLNRYSNNSVEEIRARNVWDMQAFNSKIYLGAGDYDTNMGDVPLIYFDCASKKFVTEAVFPEEQISNFVFLNDQLVIPGIDANSSQNHSWANWYIYSENCWKKYRNLPNAAHCFDIVEYDGAIFAGLGGNQRQIARSVDNGNSFELLPTYRNGKETNAFRIYDLFIQNNKLYAFNGTGSIPDLYVYNADLGYFEFCPTPLELINLWFNQSCYENGGMPLTKKIHYKNHMIFVNKKIIITKDMQEFKTLRLAPNTKILDVISRNKKLYLLSGTKINESNYQISVYSTDNLRYWSEVLHFYAPIYARSFELIDNTFFFGLGSDYDNPSIHNGEILCITIK